MPSVLCAVTSRDGRLRKDVDNHLTFALRKAAESGIGIATKLEANHYGVTICRNQVVASFLQSEHSHLLFIDDDVLVPDDMVARLLAADADVAGGCYPFMRRMDAETVKAVVGCCVDGEWPETWFDGVRDAECVPGGCMMIRREVFDAINFPWFKWGEYLRGNGTVDMTSDDLVFCQRAIDAGLSVKACGDVRCGHIKDIDLRCLMGVEVLL